MQEEVLFLPADDKKHSSFGVTIDHKMIFLNF